MHKSRNQEGFIVPLILLLIVAVGVIALTSSSKNETDKSNTQTSSNTKSTVDQGLAEQFCQDAGLLGKYIELNKVSVIKASNYNVQYQDGDGFDKDGYPIKFLQWNGEEQDKTIRFSCWISGPKNSVTLHWLSRNGQDLYGSAEFEMFNSEGARTN